MTNLENYKKASREYLVTLEVTSGCGDRGDSYINTAYEKMEKAYQSLSDAEKETVGRLPHKQKCENDGCGGMAFGLAATSRNMYR